MNCGQPHQPHDVNCAEVVEQVYLYLDGEIDDEQYHHIRLHLDECVACLREYGLEQEVKLLVARCCGGDPAPDRLRRQVLVRLRAVSLELDHVEFRAE